MTFQAWKMAFKNSMTFHDFSWPVVTLPQEHSQLTETYDRFCHWVWPARAVESQTVRSAAVSSPCLTRPRVVCTQSSPRGALVRPPGLSPSPALDVMRRSPASAAPSCMSLDIPLTDDLDKLAANRLTTLDSEFVQTVKNCFPGLSRTCKDQIPGFSRTHKTHFQGLSRINSVHKHGCIRSKKCTYQISVSEIQMDSKDNKLHTAFCNEFLL